MHRSYDAATFENDLALLELESPVHFDSHIGEWEDNNDYSRNEINPFFASLQCPFACHQTQQTLQDAWPQSLVGDD